MSLEELRRYVTANDGETRFGPSTLSLTISHSNLKQRWIEIRFDKSETIASVKEKLYKHGGTSASFQTLQLLDRAGNFICDLARNEAKLGSYPVENDMEIRIIDLDPNSLAHSGWIENTNLVEKYVMPDEVYEAREGTVRKYKQKLTEERKQKQPNQEEQTFEDTIDENFTVSKRCEVNPGARRGEIRYTGTALSLGPGIWIGVALDEPMGLNDGTIKGEKYFSCAPFHGVMVRTENVKVGDFPVRDLLESDDEM